MDWSFFAKPYVSYGPFMLAIILMYGIGYLAGARKERIRLMEPNNEEETREIITNIYKENDRKMERENLMKELGYELNQKLWIKGNVQIEVQEVDEIKPSRLKSFVKLKEKI